MEIQTVLKPELILLNMKSTQKIDAIEELAQLLKENGHITDYDTYLKAVLEREEEFTTGIGMGIAIPHGKSSAVVRPCVCFGRSLKGIDYQSEDGNPVHLAFLLAVPEESNDIHLKILANLSRKLMHKEIRDSLMQAQGKEAVFTILNA